MHLLRCNKRAHAVVCCSNAESIALAFMLEIRNDMRLYLVRCCAAGNKTSNDKVSWFQALKNAAISQKRSEVEPEGAELFLETPLKGKVLYKFAC